MRGNRFLAVIFLGCAVMTGAAAAAQTDTAYPGTLALSVDLRDTAHRVFHVEETIPVVPGPMVLWYPQWIPGEHGPTGTIQGVSGLVITADGQRVSWRRDLVDMYALRVQVPAGAHALALHFDFLSPGPGGNFGQSVSATPLLTTLEWNQVVFYPAGFAAREVNIQPSVNLPGDWGFATALEAADRAAPATRFKPVTLETLVDSPLMAGRYFKQIVLSTDPVPVRLDLVADSPADLAITDEQLHDHERLVKEAAALFGARHYGHYDFLFVLSEHTGHFGLEHHQSSDDRASADFLTDADAFLAEADLLPHEYTHSWNGKYRRPAGLLTANYNTPMQGDLLWVYEGLTQYYGEVLAARAGFHSTEQFRDGLALTAQAMEYSMGRAWRPLQDTADEAQVLYNAPGTWGNWRRGVDFYPEGSLIWLDADTLIRERSHGERSLDDFARAFYGRNDGEITPRGYSFDDLVAALDKVEHLDWAAFLRARLDSTSPSAPLDGIVRGGWKLVYDAEPSALLKAYEKVGKRVDLVASLGLIVDAGDAAGTLHDVIWKSPAFEAGLAPAMKIIAVDGVKYTPAVLKEAIGAARTGTAPIELLVEDMDQFRSVKIDYHGGLRYPHLVRIDGSEERLSAIARPRAH